LKKTNVGTAAMRWAFVRAGWRVTSTVPTRARPSKSAARRSTIGTMVWQAGQVGDQNSTRLGLGLANTRVSKLAASSTTTAVPPGAGGVETAVGLPPPPHPIVPSSAANAAVSVTGGMDRR